LKIYISGALKDEKECIKIANKYENDGHIITRKWWEFKSNDPDVKKAYANMCKKAIKECDLFILYNSDSITSGRYTELGMAIILEKMIYVYGNPLTTIFRHDCYHRKLEEVNYNGKK